MRLPLRLLIVLTAAGCATAAACANDASVPAITPDLLQPTATTISSGGDHTCALLPDGSPVCWGLNDYGQAPEKFINLPRLTAITSGGAHTCGLDPDGSWTCWGSYYHRPHVLRWWERREPPGPPLIIPTELLPPDPHDQFLAISSGLGHACALRPNGVPVCWGVNSSGAASPLAGRPLKTISSGTEHTCALYFDDSPVCWSIVDWNPGRNAGMSVQCLPFEWNLVSGCSRRQALALEGKYPGLPPEGLRLGVISSGGSHTCGLRLDGSPVCWGSNRVDEALEDERFGAISSGSFHTCALRLDGSPVCWGRNQHGQASPPEDERFVAITSGRSHTCALRVDGSPVCWGDNQHGQASPPDMRFAISLGENS